MYLDRNLVAKLLETKPHNIKSLQQVESKIYIQLGDSADKLFMSVAEYQNCLQEFKQPGQIDLAGFVTIAIAIGTLVFATMSAIDTRVINDHNTQTNLSSTSLEVMSFDGKNIK